MVIKTMRLSRELIEEAREFSKTVYKRKLARADKFFTGNEEASDFEGFLFEFAVCEYFHKPKPKLLKGTQLDEFDIFLKNKRIDIKHSKTRLINREQFERKKGKIDAFLFGKTLLLDFEAGMLFAELFGWIDYDDVVANSLLVSFKNGSEAYKVNARALKDVLELRA